MASGETVWIQTSWEARNHKTWCKHTHQLQKTLWFYTPKQIRDSDAIDWDLHSKKTKYALCRVRERLSFWLNVTEEDMLSLIFKSRWHFTARPPRWQQDLQFTLAHVVGWSMFHTDISAERVVSSSHYMRMTFGREQWGSYMWETRHASDCSSALRRHLTASVQNRCVFLQRDRGDLTRERHTAGYF